jgi:hypothetical protein
MTGTSWVVLLLAVLGLLLVHAAFAAWTTGDPSPASLFAGRDTAEVVEVRVISGRQNGAMRHVPVVRVRWVEHVVELQGLTGAFDDYRLSTAEAALRDFSVGQVIAVRIIDGAPFVDRTDWRRLVPAIWLSGFALVLVATSVGLILGSLRLRYHL